MRPLAWQKITSFLLIAFLLFGITFRVPLEMFLSAQSYALDDEYIEIVSILVDENTYSALRPEIVRYSRDIQAALPNTRAIIMPVPEEASPLDIASLNESLYYEGYKGVREGANFESRLVGTVLIGDIPIPLVSDGSNISKTIVPYVDFDKKVYVYNHASETYESSEENQEIVAEIWHGYINPNTGNETTDRQELQAYFDKNHDFYTARGLFANEQQVVNGGNQELSEDYEPYVFYYDQFRENSSLQYQNWAGYVAAQENIEDLTYNRYSRELAEKVRDQVLGVQNTEIRDLIAEVDPNFDFDAYQSGPTLTGASDVSTKFVTDAATKKYLEIFNGTALGEMREYVHNAGRYNRGSSSVNVDIPPFLVSVLDEVNAQVIKNVNDALEEEITDIVANGLSRNLIIPVSKNIVAPVPICSNSYHTFYYGMLAQDITSADQCSIYKGNNANDGTLVQANRGRNILLSEEDAQLCAASIRMNTTTGEITQGLSGYWGGNSPINLAGQDGFELGDHNLKGGIRPVFDILGSQAINDNSKVPSPLDCITQGVVFHTYEQGVRTTGGGGSDGDSTQICSGTDLQLPISGNSAQGWSCSSTNSPSSPIADFTTLYQYFAHSEGTYTKDVCTTATLSLGDDSWSRPWAQRCTNSSDGGSDCLCDFETRETLDFKLIPSYILHTSPTDEEFGLQVQELFTPNLPIDTLRYIDFIGARGGDAPNYGYERINFPQLFQVNLPTNQDITLENADAALKSSLDQVSGEINTVIQNANPSDLTQTQREIYELSQTGNYPSANIDLYNWLQSKSLSVVDVAGNQKQVSYYDTLVFAVLWNNLSSPSAKYKFIFNHYLSSDQGDDDANYALPKAKGSYEVAYFNAPGDEQNMYIKLDPEQKGTHPYAGILSENLELQSYLLGNSLGVGETPEADFACAPPDGVPIWEWFPAVICWLQDMMPPEIKIGESSCSVNTLFLSEEEKNELASCNGDVNKNGINDCIENNLQNASLELSSDAQRYYYQSPGQLRVRILDQNDQILRFDSQSKVHLELVSIDIPENTEVAFNANNSQRIFDRDVSNLSDAAALERAQSVLTFASGELPIQYGEALGYFSTRGKDANITFRASITHTDSSGNEVISLESTPLQIQVRGDRLFVTSYVWDDGITLAGNSIPAGAGQQVYLFNASRNDIENISLETSQNALLLGAINYSQAGSRLALNFPLQVRIYNGDTLVYEDTSISEADLANPFPLFSSEKSGVYTLEIEDSQRFQTRSEFQIQAGEAESLKIQAGTNVQQTGGSISTHVFTLLDKFQNIANGDIYSLRMSVSGGGLVFTENNSPVLESSTAEGFGVFQLRSTSTATNNRLQIQALNRSGEVIAQQSVTIQTVESIRMQLERLNGLAKVGGNNYRWRIILRDENGDILENFNSRIYMQLNPLYGTPSKGYFDVKNGQATVEFTTGKLAGKDLEAFFQVEGARRIFSYNFTIRPEAPVYMDLQVEKQKLEAQRGVSTSLEVRLKDRYNNVVFTDNTTQLNLEIAPQSRDIISAPQASQSVQEGRAVFRLQASDTPGTGYFKVSSNPDLSRNSFDLEGQVPFNREDLDIPGMQQSGVLTSLGEQFFREFSSTQYISRFATENALTQSADYVARSSQIQSELLAFWQAHNSLNVRGIGENAGSVETFFFWDKEDIDENSYNGIYSVLFGAPYGDVTQENYLASALLFDPENRSLAVSSILNNAYSFQDSLSFGRNGSLNLAPASMSQDLQSYVSFDKNGHVQIDISNANLGQYIGRMVYLPGNKSDILMRTESENNGYSILEQNGNLLLKNTVGQTILVLRSDGSFVQQAGLTLEQIPNDAGLQIAVSTADGTIAQIYISGQFTTQITRESSIFELQKTRQTNAILMQLYSSEYSSREINGGNGPQTALYYHDPFQYEYQLDGFHVGNILGGEQVAQEAGIGWQDSNTMLLSFASGDGMGKSSQAFQTHSLINLGDPVVSLQYKNQKFSGTNTEKSFDSSVGELISNESGMIGFQTFDYNNDQRQDILTIHRDGYVKLYEGVDTSQRFIEHQNLVFAADGGSKRLVKAGDFTGDGYGDIFFVSDSGTPELFNNVEKDFSRFEIDTQFSLSGSIIQAEVFDMDHDEKDDIVTLDSAGEIHIFYGGGTPQNPRFTKRYVGDGYGVELSDTPVKQGGAIYFTGLSQPEIDLSPSYISSTEDFLQNSADSSDVGIDPAILNDLIYVQLPYIPTQEQTDISNTTLTSYDGVTQYQLNDRSAIGQTSFLKSEYAPTQGIEISRKFTDTTPNFLQTGDTVYMDITLRNTSGQSKQNIAYVDQIPEYFSLISPEFTVLTEENRNIFMSQSGLGNYDIVLDGFSLAPGEVTTVRFQLKALALSYGYMQVGLYEDGEIGDDLFGDIILKEDEKNCGKEADIYRSLSARTYQKGLTAPSCDATALDVGADHPELIDEDNNGIPDYIENLMSADDATDELRRVRDDWNEDSDGDSIPDRYDDMPNSDDGDDFMGALDQINESIDEISGQIDEVIEGLSCGFGGGSCIATPLNWAPLAPGNDPVLMGMPIGDGLRVDEGIPFFSALTGRNVYTTHGCYQVPTVFPASKNQFTGVCNFTPGAGGKLGVTSPSNFVRAFWSPTLTGGQGTAICFGAPAIAAGNANPMGVHPIVPGGNCVVVAAPLFDCQGDEGDPGVTGYPIGEGVQLIHANCDGGLEEKPYTPVALDAQFVQEYIRGLNSGSFPQSFYDRYSDVFEQIGENPNGLSLPNQPLINIGNGEDGLMSSSVTLDSSALAGGDMQDVVQIENKRTGGFPNFFMDWVDRQLDEITSKLTNLPEVFVVLPDFGGVFDFSWKDYTSEYEALAQARAAESEKAANSKQARIDAIRQEIAALDCSGSDAALCSIKRQELQRANAQNLVSNGKNNLSGIKEVYEFLGNIPLVNIEPETINVSVPWLDRATMDRMMTEYEYARDQWKGEIERASEDWSLGAACNEPTSAGQAACEKQNSIKEKAIVDSQKLLETLNQNMAIIEMYKDFPEQLASLINKKNEWLEQVICNIEALSDMTIGWLDENGQRFKAWVELYVLIKAVLKSWQMFIDIFNDYEAECHECKNERHDLQNFTFQLVSMVIPPLPIIEFPKWPDIILDLHNIRMGLDVYVPDFQISPRPIVLPTLPELTLPTTPTAELTLPELPILPIFEIPELPDLPGIPTVELPDLPPPPKIPKLFGSLEGMLNIGKLITKAMCLLKNSPFVPEWRAGDQIAFLTERNGYLPMDFIDLQPPTFSYSALSAIKVTTYVNLEFEMEFLMELARTVVQPLNSFGNNISNSFDLKASDLNLDAGGQHLDVEINQDGSVDSELMPLNIDPEGGMNFIVGIFTKGILDLHNTLKSEAPITLDNTQFTQHVLRELASNDITSDPRTAEIQELWKTVSTMQYTSEQRLTDELKENAQGKFDTLIGILQTEIQKGETQLERYKSLSSPEFVTQISSQTEDINAYNQLLAPYNEKFIKASLDLIAGPSEETLALKDELKTSGQNLQTKLGDFTSHLREEIDGPELLAATTSTSTSSPSSNGNVIGGVCQSNGSYQYRYEGIYVLEHGKNYRLFDYTDMLSGDEVPYPVDIDNDADDDVLYLADGKLYLKENHKNEPNKAYISAPLILEAGRNPFLSGQTYIEALNNFSEAGVSDGYINIEFARPTDSLLSLFRLRYYSIVDRYMSEDSSAYIPQDVTAHMVDGVSDTSQQRLVSTGEDYSISKNIATLKYVGAMRGLTLTAQSWNNIRDDIAQNTSVTLTSSTPLYTGSSPAQIFYYDAQDTRKTLRIPARSHVLFTRPTKIDAISGDAYIASKLLEDLKDSDILSQIGMPLLPGAKFEFTGNTNTLSSSSHIDILFADGTENQMDVRDIQSYQLYDLGNQNAENYHIRIQAENDNYYAGIQAWSEGVGGTIAQQVLLAPQTQSDQMAPQISTEQKIRIPVYQSQLVDFTPYIYEDGGFAGISEARIDMDITQDADGDGNPANDDDANLAQIQLTAASLRVRFGPFESIFQSQIGLTLVDENGNTSHALIPFEVYSPDPSIQDIPENQILGKIDETLLDEPVRLYRYRGGRMEMLQNSSGATLVETDEQGNYSFHLPESASGVVLTYSGATFAEIDEYTGQVTLAHPLARIRVLPSNASENDGIYPELQILYAGRALYRHYIKMPEKAAELIASPAEIGEREGMFVQLVDQQNYGVYTIPLGAPYNPGTLVVYRSDDSERTPLLTLFSDGRLNLAQGYQIRYENVGDGFAFIISSEGNSSVIARVIYSLDAGFILR